MTLLAKIRRRYVPERFWRDEPNSLGALKSDGRQARARIDKSTERSRDRDLYRAMVLLYPESRSQDS